jgi:hypothetical protein
MQLKLMYGDNLARRWGEVSPMVDQALLHGSGSVSTYGLFLQCVTEDAQCWIDEDEYGQIKGVAITRFEFLESTKLLAIVVTTCEDWFVGGPEVLELFEEFALDNSCNEVRIYGRKGWKRVLEKYNYFEPYTVLTKRLT